MSHRRVTTAPSKKTSYVVVGAEAGAKKLETIKTLGIQTLNEDEFLELIRSRGSGEVDDKTIKAREKAEKEIQKQALELEKREKEEEASRKRKEKALDGTGIAAKSVGRPSSMVLIIDDTADQENCPDFSSAMDD